MRMTKVCCSTKDLPVVEPETDTTEDRPGCLLQVQDGHHDDDNDYDDDGSVDGHQDDDNGDDGNDEDVDDDGGNDDDDDDDDDEQDDRPAVCVPFSSCSPFMEMMANLRKPLHPSGKILSSS